MVLYNKSRNILDLLSVDERRANFPKTNVIIFLNVKYNYDRTQCVSIITQIQLRNH